MKFHLLESNCICYQECVLFNFDLHVSKVVCSLVKIS